MDKKRLSPIGLLLCGALLLTTQAANADGAVATHQGGAWTAEAQSDFYSRGQGSELMPLRWIAALKQPDGQPFMADSLSRYGYLPNPASEPAGLPVGFTASPGDGGAVLGMTCSACHTRQIEVDGTAYRIDGGPAITDFQSFLADLDTAVNAVLSKPPVFAAFADDVLGPGASAADKTKLRNDLNAWFLPYHTLMTRALPKVPWGPARLDAVSMIFDRLTGLDIGPAPTYMIPDNIMPATAPVRYPFLWNAPIQDKTQWPGFADNGNNILGLARNLGEVYGVFGVFHPKKDRWSLFGINYVAKNSADFSGLNALENLIKKIGPPKWAWAIDPVLVKQGKAIFERGNDSGGCIACHGVSPGKVRFLDQKTWATPILDVGTDSREYDVLARTVQTGVLSGAKIPFITAPLKPVDTAFNVLSISVIGAILQHYVPVLKAADAESKALFAQSPFSAETQDLMGAFNKPATAAAPSYAYESRVLEGIWAAAPYLHNGSVSSLAELLKPAAERQATFAVGPAYDIVNVGLAAQQTKFNYSLKTTGCEARNSGDSRCGHEFGTQLPADEKKALLEYLKTL
jgi:hypothetical protein